MLKRLKTVSISAGGAWPSSTDPVRQPVSCTSSPSIREGAGATTSSDRGPGGPGQPTVGLQGTRWLIHLQLFCHLAVAG